LDRLAFQANPPVRIIVKNGNVTLEGVVLNEGDKIRAFLAANGVANVFSVTNNLRTEMAKK
jgi:hyperosmotically inducible protein